MNGAAKIDPNYDSLMERARSVAARISERGAETATLRRLPDATVADMQEAGFFRMLQPERWGGFECEPGTFFDVQMTLAAACPSTAWVLGVVAVHAWQLALFSEQAQTDVWGDDPSTLVSSSYMPVGKVKRVDGGYTLSGQWGFSSGSDHCKWAFLGAFVPPGEGQSHPDMRTFLVPRADYELVDDWHVSGLKGTGSKTVVVKDAFVPEHRTHRFADGFKQNSPGNAVNDAPLYKLPFGQIFVRSVSTSSIGMAQGALNAFVAVQAERVARGDGARVAQDPAAQMVVARAAATIDAAKLTLYRNFDEMMTQARAGEPIAIPRRVQFRYESAMAVEQCLSAVNDLLTASGGSAIFLSNPINRFFQDIRASRAHYANNPDKPGRNWGSVQLGLKNQDYFI